jgi:hypothetical protein
MKHFEIDIENTTVTTNGKTCNFYEAGLYEVGPSNSTVNLTDRIEIKEVLSEQYDGEEIEIDFV